MKNEDVCWECGKRLKQQRVAYSLYGKKIGMFPAKVCGHCNETYFSEETSRKMTSIAKQKGLWGLQSMTKIGQAGSTLDIRLPKRIIKFFDLKKGEEVTIYPEDKNKMIVTF